MLSAFTIELAVRESCAADVFRVREHREAHRRRCEDRVQLHGNDSIYKGRYALAEHTEAVKDVAEDLDAKSIYLGTLHHVSFVVPPLETPLPPGVLVRAATLKESHTA